MRVGGGTAMMPARLRPAGGLRARRIDRRARAERARAADAGDRHRSRQPQFRRRRAHAPTRIETLATGLAAVRRDLEGARFIRIGAQRRKIRSSSPAAPQAVAVAVASDGTGTNEGEGLVLIEARYEEGRGVLVRSSARLAAGNDGVRRRQVRQPRRPAVGSLELSVLLRRRCRRERSAGAANGRRRTACLPPFASRF